MKFKIHVLKNVINLCDERENRAATEREKRKWKVARAKVLRCFMENYKISLLNMFQG
jgi:hypothetical protein